MAVPGPLSPREGTVTKNLSLESLQLCERDEKDHNQKSVQHVSAPWTRHALALELPPLLLDWAFFPPPSSSSSSL
ncbi:phytanoyl-CoA 2-hydroxylase interacting protein-like a isoform X2 [Tachysurus ichikawai]